VPPQAAEDDIPVDKPMLALDTGGAGLGLPIARSIVATHGGTLAAESVPGAGSIFTIRLPLA